MRKYTDKLADNRHFDQANSAGGSFIVWFLAILFIAAFIHLADSDSPTAITHTVQLWKAVPMSSSEAHGILDIFNQ